MSNTKKSTSNGFSRRDFIKTSALSSLLTGPFILSSCGNSGTTNGRNGRNGKVKNIIFMVSDGMSIGTLTAADHMLQRQYNRQSEWMRIYRENRAHRSLMDMASLDSIVTGSASAASSWGCGKRINNGAVNMGPDGEEYTPILPIARDAGKSTGLVTTTEITHATPAGFSANVPERWQQENIARQYVEREFDVMLGGGRQHFDPDTREDGQDLFGELEEKGYQILQSRDQLMQYRGSDARVLGTFYDGHVPYTLDQLNIDELKETVPTLAEMTEVALERLSGNDNGFIMQIEGGRVDHAAHGNDVSGLIYDQIAFDDAIAKAVEFAEQRDDTLVLITTDHGNANPGLSGTGSGYADSNPMFDRIAQFRRTNSWVLSELDENSKKSEIKDRIQYATDIDIRDSEVETLLRALRNEHEATYRAQSGASAVMGSILANYTAFNFISGSHTADYVELAGLGAGSEYFAEHPFVKNTDLFDVMVESTGLREYA